MIQVSQISSSTGDYLPDKQFLNMLTVKDVQFANWPKGLSKTLTFLCINHEYFVMRDNLMNNALTDLETKIYDYCLTVNEIYSPAANELCLAQYCEFLN